MVGGRLGEVGKGVMVAFDCLAAAVVFGAVVGPAELEVEGAVVASVGGA